jgi:hypothetical protein
VVKGVIVKVMMDLEDHVKFEEKIYHDHPSDDYQKGRALASRQMLNKMYAILAEGMDV